MKKHLWLSLVALFCLAALALSGTADAKSQGPMFGAQNRKPPVAPTPGSGNVLVSGAGSAFMDGTYTATGTQNGRTRYEQDGSGGQRVIAWSGVSWVMTDEEFIGSTAYFAEEDVAFPWLSTAWVTSDGMEPVPTVTELP